MERAGIGHGQIVAIIGEPGVGKSRLTAELLASQHTEGWFTLETGAASSWQIMPYLPVRDLLRAYFQINDQDDEQTSWEKVEKRLVVDAALRSTQPAVLALLEVPVR